MANLNTRRKGDLELLQRNSFLIKVCHTRWVFELGVGKATQQYERMSEPTQA